MNKKKAKQYEKLDKLGEGAYGVVYKARDRETDQMVALKKIKLDSQEEGIPSTAIRQISVLKELSHKNIVELKDVIHSNNKLILVFEFLENDLKKYMKQFGMDPLTVKSFCYQLLKGIQYCHEMKILHRDLKPQNLLISSDHVLKIADFGLARVFGIPVKGYTHEVVTLWYRPPDVLLGSQKYSSSIDIWSVGCIFAEMVNLKPLFPGEDKKDQLARIFKVLGTPTEKSWPGVVDLPDWSKYKFESFEGDCLKKMVPKLCNEGLDLLEKMLQPQPQLRITAKEALEHKYFQKLPQKLLEMYKG